MNRFAAISRADLLRCLRSPQGLDPAAAESLGYHRTGEPEPSLSPSDSGQLAAGKKGSVPEAPPETGTEMVFPDERPPLEFLIPVKAETLQLDPPPRERGDPITDAELAVDWGRAGPPLPPLTRWSRLAPFLRNRLGAILPGVRLDEKKLIRRASKGVPVAVLPHLPRAAWASQAVVLWDVTPEMDPFRQDAEWLLRRLKRERGAHGLEVRPIKGLPRRSDLAGIPAGAPVLALSAMGQFRDAEDTAAAWIALARRLKFLGFSFHALNPCPRDRWHPELAEAWPSAAWDRRPRLPRQGGLRALPRSAEPENAIEFLLDLLSPASRVEPALLRNARLRLGHEANAGTEWDAWHHGECWASPECFGFRSGPAYEARLERRGESTGADAVLAREIGGLMSSHHRTGSPVIAAEAALRACLTGTPDAASMTEVETLLRRVVDRLRLLAEDPGSADGRRCGLAAWFPGMVERLTESMRADESLAKLIAEGLALADTFEETPHTVLPAGVSGEIYKQTKSEAAEGLTEPLSCRIELAAGRWRLAPDRFPPPVNAVPLSRISASRRPVHLAIGGEGGRRHSFQFSRPASPIALPDFPESTPFTIESDRQRLHFEPFARPGWASRMWHDRHGLAAEFQIAGIPFVLRWIPPGRFLMGSPEDEPGRSENEGPRHEVAISRGFWMGETPVTQAQWRAVIEASTDSVGTDVPELEPAPSHFKGPAELPVERVNWNDSHSFCGLLDGVLPGGPGFHLPTEAQWEYACRAGTETALYTGGITIEGENNAPELDGIAWYGGNSGLELEVGNPESSKGWPNKQHEHESAGTHRVKLKQPNAWGLHDLIGNVLEWTADEWQAYSGESQTDPENIGNDDSASRVIRGGAWSVQAQNCRSAYRFWFDPGSRWRDQGLRLAAGQEQGAERPSGPERRSRG